MIFKELKLSLKSFGLLRKLVYILLNACSTCSVYSIRIGQLEVVKEYVFVSFGIFEFRIDTLHCLILKPVHCFVKV